MFLSLRVLSLSLILLWRSSGSSEVLVEAEDVVDRLCGDNVFWSFVRDFFLSGGWSFDLAHFLGLTLSGERGGPDPSPTVLWLVLRKTGKWFFIYVEASHSTFSQSCRFKRMRRGSTPDEPSSY